MARRRMARRNYDEFSYSGRRGGGNGAKIIMVVLLIAVIGLSAYWFFNPQAAPAWAQRFLPTATTELYKWQDAQGQWQYTKTPPSDRPYEKMNYWENANIIPSK